ncbi:MAG: HAD-IIIA family hydrolase [Candidatus Omnitrophica bacterium]|nr:HAD-IIIA family hydrolase [Candidatus Omnitrophota bacterium]MCM8793466.1 HAD-IIIA family hydrolase [Candidatus Omnitrophota bacterium]
MDISERAKKIKILIMDVDGVLTDGKFYYGNYGDELKAFDIQDGFGLTLLKRAGIKTIIVTAGNSRIITRRAKHLRITKVYQKAYKKLETYEKILKKFRVKDEEVCYIGDDLIDIPILKRVGFAVCVPNAREELKPLVHYITRQRGGEGAVREIAEILLKAQDKWIQVTQRYFLPT